MPGGGRKRARDVIDTKAATKGEGISDDHTDAVSSEANLMQILTLKSILKGAPGVEDALTRAAMEEVRHLILATKILQAQKGDIKGDLDYAKAVKLQEKYGRDMEGAKELAKTLKGMSDEEETLQLLRPFVNETWRNRGSGRNSRGGIAPYRDESVFNVPMADTPAGWGSTGKGEGGTTTLGSSSSSGAPSGQG